MITAVMPRFWQHASAVKPASETPATFQQTPDRVAFSGSARRDLKKLFPQGVADLQFKQGKLPDCQFLAPLYALSTNPAGVRLLENLINIQPDGKFRVTFPGHPDKPQVFHPDEMRMDFEAHNLTPVQGDLGVRAIEWAYARLNKELNPPAYANVDTSGVLELFRQYGPYHYNNAQVMRDITGWPVALIVANPKKAAEVQPSFVDKGGSLISVSGSFAAENRHSPEYLHEITRKLAKVARKPGHYIVTAQSIGKPNEGRILMGPAGQVINHHVYSIERIYPKREGLLVVNPHDTRNKVFYLSYEQFFTVFNGLSITKIPAEARKRD